MRFDDAVGEVIGAIGAPGFAGVAASAATRLLGFDLATVVVHHADRPPRLLFDDFDAAGGAEGLKAYLAATHRLNPMVGAGEEAVFRASDFAIRPPGGHSVRGLIVRDPAEELGFRTHGWPRGLEEVGLTFRACGGTVEFSCYRPKARRPAPLAPLQTLRTPLASAFRRHGELTAPPASTARLTPREHEVLDLLLLGCGTEAIALRLRIGRYTVKDHRKRIFRKLGVGSLAELFGRCRLV